MVRAAMKRSIVLALALAVGCQHHTPAVRAADSAVAPEDIPLPPPEDRPTTARTTEATAIDGGAGALLTSMADRIATEVSTLRGLSIDRPIVRGVMSRSAIVARMRTRVGEEYPAGEVELEGALYKRLGLIPEAMDYEHTMFDLLEEQVAGFYDPDARRLYIADWLPPAAQPITMAHEITHALQDQHFDIARYTHHARGRGDAQTAAMTVVEGDATVAMFDYQISQAGQRVYNLPAGIADTVRTALTRGMGSAGGEQPRLAAAPRALRETLLFPYLTGFGLCLQRVQADHNYAAVDALLRQPPESTEQVMHPDKLLAREAPVDIPAVAPAPLGADWAVAYDDVLGELGLQLYLESVVPDARAMAGAAGWGGDRAVLLVPRMGITRGADGGTTVSHEALSRAAMIWTVTMDPGPAGHPDAEAAEFADAAVEVLAHALPRGAVVTVAGARAARSSGPGTVSLVARTGRTVVVADRVPADRAGAVVHAALAGHP